jgi:hypothetical protein
MGSCGAAADELETSTPMRQTFAGCCAATGKLSAKSMAQSVRTVIFLVIFFLRLATRHSTLAPSPYCAPRFERYLSRR